MDAQQQQRRRQRPSSHIDDDPRKKRNETRQRVVDRYNQMVIHLLASMRKNTRPATCGWLSRETHVLPPIVNIVYTMTFESNRFRAPLDLVRFAQYLPNTKYRPPNFAAITIRLRPTTALLYMVGKMTLIRATTRSQALFYCHLNRQIIEQVPVILKDMDDPLGKPYVGTLEGHLDCSVGEVQNMVGSGVLPQDGVHLTRLLYSNNESVDWDPGGFPNLIYKSRLTNGTPFCANIANTGKVVLMGLKNVAGVYEAYKIVCRVVHEYDDPNTPSDPKERHKYRMRQLEQDPHFIRETDAEDNEAAAMENIGDEFGEHGTDAAAGDVDDGDQITRMFAAAYADKEIGPRLKIKMEQDVATSVLTLDSAAAADDEEPLLFQAARAGQHGNVKFILAQSGSDMRDAVWARNPETGELLIREMLATLTSADHLQVGYLVEDYLAANAPPPPPA